LCTSCPNPNSNILKFPFYVKKISSIAICFGYRPAALIFVVCVPIQPHTRFSFSFFTRRVLGSGAPDHATWSSSSPALSSAPRWLEKSWLPMVISSRRRPWVFKYPAVEPLCSSQRSLLASLSGLLQAGARCQPRAATGGHERDRCVLQPQAVRSPLRDPASSLAHALSFPGADAHGRALPAPFLMCARSAPVLPRAPCSVSIFGAKHPVAARYSSK
jgi:hypothetical protein